MQMNKRDILKIILGSALVTTLLSSMTNFITSNVHELYGQLAKQMIYNSNFAYRFYLCTLKIQYLAGIRLSKFCSLPYDA